MEDLRFVFKNGILSKPKRLIINDKFISINSLDASADNQIILNKEFITGYQFGIRWYKFYFVFGRNYVIRLKYSDSSIIKINFPAYFGYNKQKNLDLYYDILDGLWNFHFSNIADQYIREFQDGIIFEIDKVIFSANGITFKKRLSFKQDVFLDWQKVRTKSYYSYFAIYSVDDSRNVNFTYSYKDDWNTNVLYSVLRTILKHKNIEIYD